MVYTVRGKDFKINLINNWVSNEYQKMVKISDDSIALQGKIGKLAKDSVKEGIAEVEAKKIYDEILKLKEDFSSKCDDILILRMEILKEIIVSNDIEYDENWWIRRTSSEDINDFILSCLKDGYEPGEDSTIKKKAT